MHRPFPQIEGSWCHFPSGRGEKLYKCLWYSTPSASSMAFLAMSLASRRETRLTDSPGEELSHSASSCFRKNR
jgi:hypothetical protein